MSAASRMIGENACVRNSFDMWATMYRNRFDKTVAVKRSAAYRRSTSSSLRFFRLGPPPASSVRSTTSVTLAPNVQFAVGADPCRPTSRHERRRQFFANDRRSGDHVVGKERI